MVKRKTCPECFSLISVSTRAKIIQQLKRKPSKVSKIKSHFSLTQPTISHHLRILEKMGIVFSRKKGREIYYYLNKKYPCKKCSLLKLPFKL